MWNVVLWTLCFVSWSLAQDALFLEGAWQGGSSLTGPFTVTFNGSFVTITAPKFSFVGNREFSLDFNVEPNEVTLFQTDCLLQYNQTTQLRAIWQKLGNVADRTERIQLAISTSDCAINVPMAFERAPGVLVLTAVKVFEDDPPTPIPPTAPPTPRATAPALQCAGNYSTIGSIPVNCETEEVCQCIDGRIGQECTVCINDTGCLNDYRCDTMSDVLHPLQGWYCEPRFDQALVDYLNTSQSINNARISGDIDCNGNLQVVAWTSETSQQREFLCEATECVDISQTVSADADNDLMNPIAVRCEKTKCWCGRDEGCFETLQAILDDMTGFAEFVCSIDGKCRLKQKELLFIIEAQCQRGACVPPVGQENTLCGAGVTTIERAVPLETSQDGAMVMAIAIAAFLGVMIVCCCACILCGATSSTKLDQDMKFVDTEPLEPGVTLSWLRLRYGVRVRSRGKDADDDQETGHEGSRRWLLRDVTGEVRPGQMLAVMGASGAGKTTLLDILAGWRKSGQVKGSILVDGQPRQLKQFKKISGYVPQEEPFLPTLTVREQLEFTADLTFSSSVSADVRAARINQVLSDVGLSHVANTRIGSGGHEGGSRGISGGERKRLSVANQLLSRPRILFLDEPTSGLDATNALSVISVLHKLAHDKKQTIVLSIHQPRYNIFALFDKLLLLRYGELMYMGAAKQAPSQFSRLGFKCPAGVNFADFALDTLAVAVDDDVERFKQAARTPLPPSRSSSSDNEADEVDERSRHHRRRHRSRGRAHSKGRRGRSKSRERGHEKHGRRHHSQPRSGMAVVEEPLIDFEGLKENLFEMKERHHHHQHHHKRAHHNHRHHNNRRSNNRYQKMEEQNIDYDSLYIPSDLNDVNDDNDDNTGTENCCLAAIRCQSYPVSMFKQIATLARRAFYHTIRTWRLMVTHAVLAVVLALFVGAIYWDRGTGLAGFQDRLGSLFFTIALFAFANLSVLDLFVSERALFVREREAGLYSPISYFLGKVLVDMPMIRMIPPLIYGAIVYFMIGYRPGLNHLFVYLIVMALNSIASASLLYSVATAVPTVAIGNVIGSLLMLFFMLFGGFLLNNASAPPYVIWLQEFSFFNHAFEATASNELAGARFQFDPKGYFSIDIDGQAFLDQLAFSPNNLMTNLYALIIMSVVYLTGGYLWLHFVVRSVR